MKAAQKVWSFTAVALLGCVLAMPALAQSPAVTSPTARESQSAASAPALPPKTTAPPAKQIIVPSGTHFSLVLENAISTKTAKPGDPVYFQTIFPVLVENRIVMPAGTYVSGEVIQARRAGRVKGRAELLLKLHWMILPNGYAVDLEASPTGAGTGGNETVTKEGQIQGGGNVGHDAGVVARTTAVGGGIGAAAGGLKGAGVGLGTGAAVGLAAVLLTRGPEAELPRGTTLDIVLDRPIALDASRVNFTTPGEAPQVAGPPNRKRRSTFFPF